MANWILERYGNFIARRPVLILTAMLLFLTISIIASTQVKTTAPSYKEMMPKQIPEIDAMNFIQDEFGTAGESVTIAIEINPRYANSSEVRDIREPSVMKYCELLEQKIARMKNVISIGSPAVLLQQMNAGYVPQSKIEIIELIDKYPDQFAQYITKDYSLALIKIQIAGMESTRERDEFAAELKQIVAETPQPAGVKTSLAGSLFIMIELREQIGPTMASTSTFSFIGILIIVFLLFMSIRHGIISLLGLGVGVILAYGLLALLGVEISSQMSGGIAMIMGVGIDFGIQVVTRFRYELQHSTAEQAITTTLANTMKPMFITVISALTGFTALSLGKMTVLRELGNMMSIGILMCFLGAITVIPSILIINEKYLSGKK
ncbi:MAG: MMPL family transporter [Methanocellales archaeon]